MSEMLITERLVLRRWRHSDREPFARMNADPRVMQYMPAVLSREESNALVDRVEEHFEQHGFGPYALEFDGQFIGYTGLWTPTFEAHFTPCVEIGWRLDAQFWNQGFATEAARRVVEHTWADLPLNELVSFTVPSNLASRRVMEKLGMSHNEADDFDHPRIPPGDPLRRHVLYRLKRVSRV